MLKVLVGTVLTLLMVLPRAEALAEPVSVRFSEGITRGFPVLQVQGRLAVRRAGRLLPA